MATRFKNEGRIAIIDVYDRLTVAEADGFRAEVVDALDSGCKTLLVNLSDIDFIDSSGIGAIMGGRRLAGMKGRTFGVFGVGGRTRDIFEMTRLDQVLNIFEDECEAIRALGN
ncbi:MAG: STAS domain-containing protein [bacterium]